MSRSSSAFVEGGARQREEQLGSSHYGRKAMWPELTRMAMWPELARLLWSCGEGCFVCKGRFMRGTVSCILFEKQQTAFNAD